MPIQIGFVINKDKRSCTMFVDNKYLTNNIPYIPEKYFDHRGLNLYLYLKEKNKLSEKFEIENSVENKEAITQGYNYMFNPSYVRQAILEFSQYQYQY